MSSNADQMIRSGILAVSTALSECQVPGVSGSAMLKRYEWQRLKIAIKEGRWREGVRSMARQFVLGPGFASSALWADFIALTAKLGNAVGGRLGFRTGEADAPRHFYDFDPRAGIDFAHKTAMSRALHRLSRLDQHYRPKAAVNAARSSRGTSEDPAGSVLFTALDPHRLDCPHTYQEG
jgi:hypothetical protein